MAYGKISLTVLTVLVFRQKISFSRTLRASKPQLARSGVMIFAVAVRELTNRLTQQLLLLHSDCPHETFLGPVWQMMLLR